MIAQPTLFAVRSVDLFAGGGGASEGIRLATGQAPLEPLHTIMAQAARRAG